MFQKTSRDQQGERLLASRHCQNSLYGKRNPNFVRTFSAQRTINVTFSIKTVRTLTPWLSVLDFWKIENKSWILVTCSCGGDGRSSLPVDTAKIGKVCNIYGKNFTHFDGSWETYLFCYGLTATYYLMHNGLNVLKLPWFLWLRCSIIWIYWRKNKYFMSGSFHFSFFVFWSTLTKERKNLAVIFRQTAKCIFFIQKLNKHDSWKRKTKNETNASNFYKFLTEPWMKIISWSLFFV